MALLLTNNATSLLAANISAAATSLNLTSGDEGKYPSPGAGDWFPLVLADSAGNIEIMRCTARTGVVCTVLRGQEGTTARAWTAGARADLRVTKAALDGLSNSVSKAGDTMTGDLTLAKNGPGLFFVDSAQSNKTWTAFNNSGNFYIGENDQTPGNVRLRISPGGAVLVPGALQVNGTFSLNGDTVQVAEGGTGAANAADARTNLSVYSKAETDTKDAARAQLVGGNVLRGAQVFRGGDDTTGFTSMNPGTTDRPGYLRFASPDGTSRGYIGWMGAANRLQLNAENGWGWEINGALDINGGAVFNGSSPLVNGGLKLRFHYPGVRIWNIGGASNGNFYFTDESAGADRMFIATDGNIWTSMFGYLSTYIYNTAYAQADARGAAWANDRVASMRNRLVSAGTATVGSGGTDIIAPGGALLNRIRTNSSNNLNLVGWLYIQHFDPVNGWRTATNE